MMTVEEKPDVTYSDIGGSKEQIDKMREVVELPMLHPEKFVALGIDPPKGVLCYGPPGTGVASCLHQLHACEQSVYTLKHLIQHQMLSGLETQLETCSFCRPVEHSISVETPVCCHLHGAGN